MVVPHRTLLLAPSAWLRRCTALLIAVVALWLPTAADAQEVAVPLEAGWNNVAYLGETLPVADALANAGPEIEAVWEWSAPERTWRAFVPGDPFLSDLVVLTSGNAYWVRATATVDWRQPATIQFTTGALEIVTAQGTRTLEIEIADTVAERARGLMFRQSLAEDAGMLFLFGTTIQSGFWMQNTYIPLSIAYIDVDGRIVDILDMEPLTTTINTPDAPYRWALEVNQGWFEANGVDEGDPVRLIGR